MMTVHALALIVLAEIEFGGGGFREAQSHQTLFFRFPLPSQKCSVLYRQVLGSDKYSVTGKASLRSL